MELALTLIWNCEKCKNPIRRMVNFKKLLRGSGHRLNLFYWQFYLGAIWPKSWFGVIVTRVIPPNSPTSTCISYERLPWPVMGSDVGLNENDCSTLIDLPYRHEKTISFSATLKYKDLNWIMSNLECNSSTIRSRLNASNPYLKPKLTLSEHHHSNWIQK